MAMMLIDKRFAPTIATALEETLDKLIERINSDGYAPVAQEAKELLDAAHGFILACGVARINAAYLANKVVEITRLINDPHRAEIDDALAGHP